MCCRNNPTAYQNASEGMLSFGALLLVKKLACGDFFDDFCTVCLGAYGSPGGKRRAAAILSNPLLRKDSETTGRVSEANRGSRTAQSAPQSRSPKPTEGRDWAAIHAAGFGLAIGGLRPSDTSGAFSTV